MNVTEPIRRSARLNPAATAIIRADGTTISYALLEHAIDAMARRAEALGMRSGDTAGLAVTGPDESLSLTLMLGLARIGVTTAEPTLPAERLKLRFRTGFSVAPDTVMFDAGWMPNALPDPLPAPVPIHRDPNAVLRILESSGTTGTPKQVIVTHAQMAQRVMLRALVEGEAAGVRIIGLGFGGNFGLQFVLRVLWGGGTIVLTNPREAAAMIPNRGVTSIVTTPVSLRTTLDALGPQDGPFPALRSVYIGGSFLPPPLYALAAARLTPHILVTMGSAEASGVATAPVRALIERPGAVGYIWPGVEVEALDEQGRPLPEGEAGVLRIRSPMLATGYLDPGDEVAEQFRDGWFYSNDVGTVWPDGLLTLSGRVNEVINAGGVKVHPHVIETALLKLPTVQDAAAFGVPDSTGLTRIQAAIVAPAEIDQAVLSAFCLRMLGALAPVGVMQMKAIPRNDNGKIMRDRLVDAALQMMEAQGVRL